MTSRAIALLSGLAVALSASGARAALDRAPEILEYRQVGTSIRLLWAPGGKADGTFDPTVVSYALERKVGGAGWAPIFTGDAQAMTFVDDVAALYSWTSTPNLRYRVRATTNDSATALSEVVGISPALPLSVDEAQDGKARLDWLPSQPPAGYPLHLGYVVQKKVGASWVDQTGYIQALSYIDPLTATGATSYRMRSVYQKAAPQSGTLARVSNGRQITIQPLCAGQLANPLPLAVIEIGDLDADLDYDGDDIAAALQACALLQYEDLSGPGDDDGVCEPGNGESCITGGCILRALPKTYDDVAIMITNWSAFCDDDPEAPPETWYDVTHPEHCLVLDFPAGLVIEGQGSQTVFRSPVWDPPYVPASVLEVHRRAFPVTLRNLVLDGRKHDQVYPAWGSQATWNHYGFRIWNQFSIGEIAGDGIGNENGACEFEACSEQTGGSHDGDGRCEAGEDCVDGGGGSCDNDVWTNTSGCFSTPSADDGCIHNVEARNVLSTGVVIMDAQRWIVEDSEFHDMGCVNRGDGFDCPNFGGAPDDPSLPGYLMTGYGLGVGAFTSEFQVRRNEFYRTSKYGLYFKNGDAASCHGRIEDHEVAYNVLHDLGHLGIFSHGTAGMRVHHNTIRGTTLWNEPPAVNAYFNTFGMSLGGLCSDDNVFSDNTISDSAGLAIMWDGTPETVSCTPAGCTPVAVVGNTIRDNAIQGACVEKDTTPGTPGVYGYGAIQTMSSAAGPLALIDNTVDDNLCSFAVAAFGQLPWTQPLALEVTGGRYESGPNAATLAESGFYCGALHAHGSNRKIVVRDDTSIVNTMPDTIPKACIGYDATIVIDDVPTDPFADGPYTSVHRGDGTGTIVECSATPSHPDCL